MPSGKEWICYTFHNIHEKALDKSSKEYVCVYTNIVHLSFVPRGQYKIENNINIQPHLMYLMLHLLGRYNHI